MHTVLLVVILVLLLANVGVSVACLVKANKKNEPYEEGESVSELRLDGVSDSDFANKFGFGSDAFLSNSTSNSTFNSTSDSTSDSTSNSNPDKNPNLFNLKPIVQESSSQSSNEYSAMR
jgi:hypothetical protein